MMTEGHLFSHTRILVKQVPEELYVPNVPVMSISFIFYEYQMNHLLILFVFNRLEWVDSIWCDSDQHESSRNICDSKLQEFLRPTFSTLKLFLRSELLKILLPVKFSLVLSIVPCHGEPL